jgi:hypothetical protein
MAIAADFDVDVAAGSSKEDMQCLFDDCLSRRLQHIWVKSAVNGEKLFSK